MSYQTKSWERDRPPVFAQKVAYIDDLAVTITPPRHVVGSRVETQDDFDEMSEWLTANCRWTFRIIGRPLPPSPDWGRFFALLAGFDARRDHRAFSPIACQ